MLEVVQRNAAPGVQRVSSGAAASTQALVAGWREGLAIVNLRGDAEDPAFRHAAATALGVALPARPCTGSESGVLRIVWAGPDDWFIVGPQAAPTLDDAIGTIAVASDVS